MAHVVGLLLMDSVRYHGGFAKFFRTLAMSARRWRCSPTCCSSCSPEGPPGYRGSEPLDSARSWVRSASRTSSASCEPSSGRSGVALIRRMTLSWSISSSETLGPVAGRHGDRAQQPLLDPLRAGVAGEAGPDVDLLRLAQRHHGQLQEDAVGDQQPVGPLAQGGVEEAERGDGALHRAGQGAADQAHPFADPEGPGALQDDAGEDPAQRLLRGEPEQDRGEGAADRQRAGVRRRRSAAPGSRSRSSPAGGRRSRRCPRSPGPAAGTSAAPAPSQSQWVAAVPTITSTITVPIRNPFAVAGGDLAALVVDDQGRGRSPAARPPARRGRAWRRAASSSSPSPSDVPGVAARLEQLARQFRGRRGAGIKVRYPAADLANRRGGRRCVDVSAQRRRPFVAGGEDRDRLVEAADVEHPADLVVVAADDQPPAAVPGARRPVCQARTIRAIPVESMNSHSERSIRTEASPPSTASLERPLQIGAVLEVELAADRDESGPRRPPLKTSRKGRAARARC